MSDRDSLRSESASVSASTPDLHARSSVGVNSVQTMGERDPPPGSELLRRVSFLRLAKRLTANSAAVLGGLYALGFFVDLLHLSRFGVLSVNLLRAQYVLAGVWLILPLGLAAAILFIGITTCIYEYNETFRIAVPPLSSPDAPHHWILIDAIVTGSATGIGLAMAAAAIFMRALESLGQPDLLWSAILRPLPFALLVILIAACLTLSEHLLREGRDLTGARLEEPLLGPPWWLVLGAFLMAIMVAYMTNFSRKVYPQIPAELGGGQDQRVTLSFESAAIESTVTSRVYAARVRGAARDEFRLLLVTDRSIYLVGENSSAVEVPRECIRALVVHSTQPVSRAVPDPPSDRSEAP